MLALAAYAYVFLPYLPKSNNTGGSDYSYFMPQMLAGYYWFLHNGLFSVPWFTPAFCAGVPYFGNMQGIYYSLPQFLTFIVPPAKALQISFMAFAAMGMGGFYALTRTVFGMGRWIALAAAVLFLFNSFFAARFLVAHLTFHAFMLVPLLAVCAFAGSGSSGRRGYFDIWILFGTLILSYMVQSGMIHALPPSLLAIVGVFLVHGYINRLRIEPFIRLLLMGCIALAISAAKLVAGTAYLLQFPRAMIPLSGFGEIWQAMGIAVQSLFSAPAFGKGAAWLQNNEWFPDTNVVLAFHEFEYGVTYIPALIIIIWLVAGLLPGRRQDQDTKNTTARLVIISAFGLLLAIPVFLNWYEPSWTGFLKSLPFFGNSSTLIRWYALYIPLVILISMLIVHSTNRLQRIHAPIALIIIAFVISHNIRMDREHYIINSNYNFATIEAAYARIQSGAPVPAVSRVEWPGLTNIEMMTRRDRNEPLVRGATNAQCYEPMFGHRLEEYPYKSLRAGPTLSGRDGVLNIKNPACMHYPDANDCRPGDHFATSDLAAATEFVNYRPFPFEFPWWQTLANWVSLVSFLVVIAGIVACAVRRLPMLRRQRAPAAAYTKVR
jgi:hypothetical protein